MDAIGSRGSGGVGGRWWIERRGWFGMDGLGFEGRGLGGEWHVVMRGRLK